LALEKGDSVLSYARRDGRHGRGYRRATARVRA
jgi:hypothetical protein